MAIDNFTDTNGTALDTHDSAWDSAATMGVSNAEIQNNVLRASAVWVRYGGYYNNGQPADHESEVVHKVSASGWIEKGASVRMSASADGYALYLSDPVGGNYTTAILLKDLAWLGQGVGSWPINSDHTLRLTVSGSTTTVLTGYVDGTSIVTYNDTTTPHTTGYPGLWGKADGTLSDTDLDGWTDNIGGATTYYSTPSGSITCSGSLSRSVLFSQSIAGSTTPSGVINKKIMKALIGACLISGYLSKLTKKKVAGTISVIGIAVKKTFKRVSGLVLSSGGVSCRYTTTAIVSGAVALAGSVAGLVTAWAASIMGIYPAYRRRKRRR